MSVARAQLGGAMMIATALAVPDALTQPETRQQQIAELWAAITAFPETIWNTTSQQQAAPFLQTEDVWGEIPVEYVETRDLPPGMSQVVEEGSPGLYRQVYEVDPLTQQREMKYIYPLVPPKPKVIARNSQPAIGEKFDLENLVIKRVFIAEATAYTHTGYRTASGAYPRYGLIATDPQVIPLGTKLYVEGYGYAIAADTGGAIKGDKIDVFFDTRGRCFQWGRRHVKVFVLEELSI